MIFLITILVGCENNVYIPGDHEPPKVWEVQGKHFYKFSEAISYYMEILDSKDISEDEIITLLRDVPETERGEAIIIPDTFPEDGVVRVDFNNHEYWFEDDLEYFFQIKSGDTVEIVNGTTVIDVPANPVPLALVVNTKTVTIDDHLIDDRRPVPKSLEVQSEGIVKVQSSSSSTKTVLKGEIRVAEGGQLDIQSGSVEVTTLTASGDVSISGGSVDFANMNLQDGSSVLVFGGITSFWESVTKDAGAEFKTYNGTVHYTHFTIDEVTQAINEGAEDTSYTGGTVITELIHTPLTEHPGTPATCISTGLETYWECETCHRCFSDQACTHDITDQNPPIVIPMLPHSLTLYPYVEPTCTVGGSIEYWHCSVCDKYFSDEGITEITEEQTIIPPTGHAFDTIWHTDSAAHWHECTHECGTKSEYGQHDKKWDNDKNYHWAKCSVCGYMVVNKEPHTFVTIGGVTYCTFCGYIPESGGGVQSGFDVTVKDLIPAGYLTSSALDPTTNKYTVTFTSTNEESEPDHFNWYIDDVLVPGETGTSLEAEYRYESFNVMIVFWNDQGTGSASITLD